MSKWELYKIRVLSVIYWGRDILLGWAQKAMYFAIKNPLKYLLFELSAWGFTTILFILILLRG